MPYEVYFEKVTKTKEVVATFNTAEELTAYLQDQFWTHEGYAPTWNVRHLREWIKVTCEGQDPLYGTDSATAFSLSDEVYETWLASPGITYTPKTEEQLEAERKSDLQHLKDQLEREEF